MNKYGYEYKNELLEAYKNYKPILHTNQDRNFDYLDDNSFCIEIENKSGKNMFIDLEADITVSFTDWHCHYNVYDYDAMKDVNFDIGRILDNAECVLNAYSGDELISSTVYPETVTPATSKKTLLNQFKYLGKINLRKITRNHGIIKVNYWDVSKNFEIRY